MNLIFGLFRLIRYLVLVEDDFVRYLFQIIEGLSDDAHDPYHYPVIRVLVRFCPCLRWSYASKLTTTNTAGVERAIHGIGARSGFWDSVQSAYEQSHENTLRAWKRLQNLWRKHNSTNQSRR
jgi:hypothetical protein